FTWTTYPERLEAAGIGWQVYQYGTPGKRHHNILKYFGQYQNAPAGSPLALRGMADTDEERFAQDVLQDRLPTVSWICPSAEASEHPHHNMPAAGADFIARRLGELAA